MNPSSGFLAVTDFTTNQVYIVNGWREPTMSITAPTAGDPGGGMSPDVVTPEPPAPLMMRYDGATGAVSSMGAGSKFEVVKDGFTGCWSSLRNSFLLHGGFAGYPLVYQKTLYEFIPSNPKYTTISDTGAAPSARYGHCLVEAYNGTKMVLFGGQGQSSAVLSDIYILDVEKMSWKAGKVWKER
ncbi:hypothetical protein BGX24_003267 [Mortierella sp. AD032]|nr:hypothetical protein BGX24_003267 [Mortierella sp. AD032]